MTHDEVTLARPGDLARLVFRLRRRRGWSQAQLAGAVGRSAHWVSKIERAAPGATLGDALRTLAELGAEVVVRPVADADERQET